MGIILTSPISSPDMVKLGEVVADGSSATLTLSSITAAGYSKLLIFIDGTVNAPNTSKIRMFVNGDTTNAHYVCTRLSWNESAVATARQDADCAIIDLTNGFPNEFHGVGYAGRGADNYLTIDIRTSYTLNYNTPRGFDCVLVKADAATANITSVSITVDGITPRFQSGSKLAVYGVV